MRSGARLIRWPAVVSMYAFLGLLPLAGCATPRSEIQAAALKPSGKVTMTQILLSGSGVGGGVLTFRGKTYPFTLVGSLQGFGALYTMQASGEVFNLNDVSRFSGAYIQGSAGLAVPASATGKLWLMNRNGVIMRLAAEQAGFALSSGQSEIFIELTQ
jgi:hypothetical protein